MSLLRKLSLTIIIGTVFGIFLGTYGVLAFAAPSAIPPGANVLPFINVGPTYQEKTGDLWANSLGTTGGIYVGGYLQLAETSGAPPLSDCDNDSEKGRMKYDPSADAIFSCNGASGWATINAGSAVTCYRDADGDGRTTGEFASLIGSCPGGYAATQTLDDCDDNNANIWRLNYADVDGDGFGLGSTSVCGTDTPGAGRVFDNTDCLDTVSEGADYYPGNLTYYDGGSINVIPNWDHNCNGLEDKKPVISQTCQTVFSAGDKGCWITSNNDVGASTSCGSLNWANSCVHEADGGCFSLGINPFYGECR